MKKIVITFGLISGAIASGMMLLTLPLMRAGIVNFDNGEVLGYSSILLSFMLVFFGIRSYRENVGGGAITFGKGFQVGLLITLISSFMYVATWQVIYFGIEHDFADRYAAHAIQKMRDKGATEAEVAAEQKKMADFKVLYDNPLFNAAITLIEPVPVGLVVTLVSAGILRRRRVGMVPAAAVA